MAQQTLDFIIANQVTGMNEIAKLTNSVGALQKATANLNARTAELERMMGAGAKATKGFTNPLDAQSKALRNQSQGLQQAGMQVNDFVTSVSTGASPVQAFNQQIGQLGYAMSMMGGAAGRVGTFLAGPWGALVIGASMALGYLWESFNKTEEATIDVTEALDFSKMSFEETAKVAALLAEQNKKVERTSYQAAAALMTNARASMASAQAALTNARAKAAEARAEFDSMGPRERIAFGAAEVLEAEKRVKSLEAAARQAESSFAKAEAKFLVMAASMSEKAVQIEGLQTRMNLLVEAAGDLGRVTPEIRQEIKATAAAMSALRGNTEKNEAAIRNFARASSEAVKAVSPLEKELAKLNLQAVKLLANFNAGFIGEEEFVSGARLLSALEKIAKYEDVDPLKKVEDRLDRIYQKSQREKEISDAMRSIVEAGSQPLVVSGVDQDFQRQTQLVEAQVDRSMANVRDIMRGYTEEMSASFNSIGESVAEAFKGMITGAQSFGDAMKGIVQSVIDELFRLFVVQQIVGFVSNALGSAFGAFSGASPSGANHIPAGATGGYPAPGKPVMVGERGPEMFVPTSSGKIIPNHRMGGGGGMVVNVDARGSTDPEAVRQQVQRGILEAAPAIVAAAEQRTISTLSRPRLAGAL